MLRARICSLSLSFALVLMALAAAWADGVSAVKSCESDNEPPDDIARLTVLPNGETRGGDTAAALVRMARQKAREGKDTEAVQWAALCNFSDQNEQEAIKRDSTLVLQYLKQ